MFERLKAWLLRLFGIDVQDEHSPAEVDAARYEQIDRAAENMTAIIAGKLANLVFGDSTLEITTQDGKEPTERVKFIADLLERMFCDEGVQITSQVFGKGGKVLVPYLSGDKLRIAPIDQSRMIINRQEGSELRAVSLVLDSVRQDDVRYFLICDYDLEGTTLTMRYRVMSENDATAELSAIRVWADISPEITITNVQRLPLAHLKCPKDDRRTDHRYGVPITFGCDALLGELAEHAQIYRREYKLTRPMLGMDSTLFRRWDGQVQQSTIDDIRKTVQDSDDPFIPFEASTMDGGSMWQLYAPNIRQQAMEERYQSLLRRLERACGLSQGVLTERAAMNYATRDEIRAAQYDTFTVISAMRDRWEHAIDDLIEACDVLCERFHLTPAGSRGQCAAAFDWDSSMIESTTETFSQMSELQAGGMVSKAELRAWVMGETVEEATDAITGIEDTGDNANDSELDKLLNGMTEEE